MWVIQLHGNLWRCRSLCRSVSKWWNITVLHYFWPPCVIVSIFTCNSFRVVLTTGFKWNTTQQTRNFHPLICTFCRSTVFSSPSWMHHPHLCDCHLTASKHTYLASLSAQVWPSSAPVTVALKAIDSVVIWSVFSVSAAPLLTDDSARMNKLELPHAPNPIQKSSVLKPLSLPAPPFSKFPSPVR